MMVTIPTTTTVLVSASLLLFIAPTALAFTGLTPKTSFYLSQTRPTSTTSTTTSRSSTSLHPNQPHRRILSSSSTSPPSSITTLNSTPTPTTGESNHKNKEQILSDIVELTSSFEEVQQTIQTNTVLYEERLDEYESTIQSLQTELSTLNNSLLDKDGVLNRTKLELEEGMQEKASLVVRLEELELEVREGKFELEERGMEIKVMEQRRLALVEETKMAEEEAKKAEEEAKKAEEEAKKAEEEAKKAEEVKNVAEEAAKKAEEEAAKKVAEELFAAEEVKEESQSSPPSLDDTNNDDGNNKVINDYEERIQLLEKEASSTKNTIQEKDTKIATLQTNLSKQQRSASAATSTSNALTARIDTLKQEAGEMTLNLAAKTNALATMEQSLADATTKLQQQQQKQQQQQQLQEKLQEQLQQQQQRDERSPDDLNSDIIIDGLERLLRRKDEVIAELESTVRELEGQLQPGAGRELEAERDGLRRERDDLVVELNSVTERMKIEARKGIVEVMSKAMNEKSELQSSVNMSLEEKGEFIRTLEMKIEAYEVERCSLRQLTRLGFARCVSVFNGAYE